MQKKVTFVIILLVVLANTLVNCNKSTATNSDAFSSIRRVFGSNIDPEHLLNYQNQQIPNYITKDNTGNNAITNTKATLGRVLFYDKQLSINNSIACANCHHQKFAFSDTALVSTGVESGVTVRHSMRLVNSRFSSESHFFWNERASTLENQTIMPLQDHAEMGYSGQNGRPGLSVLLSKLQAIDYYQELFRFAYGDNAVTEERLKECLAQFVRSIQSFDSKYDVGRALVTDENSDFPNFTNQENSGKTLFLNSAVFDGAGNRISGGLGCGNCHRAPEFDIDPQALNNGIIGIANSSGIDINNTKAPTLRNLVRLDGTLNGPLMHTGVIKTLQAAIGHYGTINLAAGNNNLDPRLKPNGFGQQLHLNAQEVNAMIAFLKTLSGSAVYSDERWSNPFL